jgi:hypothetical protein
MITRKYVNFIYHSVFQILHENIRELNNVNKAIEIPTETDRNFRYLHNTEKYRKSVRKFYRCKHCSSLPLFCFQCSILI